MRAAAYSAALSRALALMSLGLVVAIGAIALQLAGRL
jgi:hypothetical protein